MGIRNVIRNHPRWTVAAVIVGLGLFVFGFLWFRPDRLFTDRRVDEAVPGQEAIAEVETPEPTQEPAEEDPAEEEPAEEQETGPATLARGRFISLEHQTRGRAVVLETQNGRRFLRFEDFETSDGPDLLVYLSTKEPSGPDDWRGYDQDFVDLGPLKGNIGNQNYEIPKNVDLDSYSTAVVWCRRFTVGFAAAVLD